MRHSTEEAASAPTATTIFPSLPAGDAFVAGARDTIPAMVSLTVFGFAIGAAVAASSFDNLAGWLAGPLLFAGSAHLVLLSALEAGSGPGLALAAASAVNLRFGAYGAALLPVFADQPRWFRWLAPFGVVDHSFALALDRASSDDRRGMRRYWAGLTIPVMVLWPLVILAGMSLGPIVPVSWNLMFCVPLLFVGLAAPTMKRGRSARAALTAAFVTILGGHALGGVGMVLAIACGVVAGAVGSEGNR